jgi:uncharacterized protein YcbK (DUF882 family)
MNFLQILNKESQADICYKLNNKEFACKCSYASCKVTLYSSDFIRAYGLSRAEWGKPFLITSGFRCQRHNEDIGGANGSKHALGMAIDISIVDLNEVERARLAKVLRAHFDFVKIYPTFIHAQVNG